MLNINFIANVRLLIGKSYAECDCKDVICQSLGIRMAGTNWLWRSINNSSKYRYLTARWRKIPLESELLPGDILFKIRDEIPIGYTDHPDAYHVGVYCGNGIVIHSSPSTGVREDSYVRGRWHGFGRMKQVDYGDQHENASRDPNTTSTELTDHDMIKAIYNKICTERND